MRQIACELRLKPILRTIESASTASRRGATSLPGVSEYDLSSGVNLPPPELPPSLPLLFSHLYSLFCQQQLPLGDGPVWLILYKFCFIPGEPSRLLYFLITSDSEQRILQPS
ncbi:hypothetical protein KQX54_009729 [Cotesia glomerata]|uniref:Uncharacterized protein n=1 Tax=Cotesia glomerata TaxID=32391 RepID=A0AAV7IB56_COTGL|nr:hypothetical protein KQX54_009729 [Cotesia glomerata]